MMRVTSLLSFLILAIFHQECKAASKVDHHTVKMHTSFIKSKKDGDFSDWEEAFKRADHDKNGLVSVHEASRVFKEHYNLVHKHSAGRGAASEVHYMDDGSEFGKMVSDTMGWDDRKEMTYAEFEEQLHVYVDIKHKERGSLYDLAADIF